MSSFSGFGVEANLGIESMFHDIFNAHGTKECGSRPTCLGWSDGCAAKQEAYGKCTLAAAEARAKRTNSIIIVTGIVAVVVALIILSRRQ